MDSVLCLQLNPFLAAFRWLSDILTGFLTICLGGPDLKRGICQ